MKKNIIIDSDNPASQVDVAKLAGVSDMTVHRVLSNHPYVRESTRRKVLEACSALNYRPNLLASSLRTKKSYALGLIVAPLKVTYFARLVDSVEVAASDFSYHTIVVQLQKGSSAKKQKEELEFLLQRQIDGLIVATVVDPEVSEYLLSESIPVISTEDPIKGFSWIGSADLQGAYEAVSHLIRLGHKKIAHLAGNYPLSYTSKQRLEGYKHALTDAGIDFSQELIVHEGWTQEDGYSGVLKLLDNGIKFSAIFAANDYVAVGAMLALYEKGIKIPDDVSIIGFAGDSLGQWSIPPLSTVYQPIEEVGREAVELILKQCNSGRKKQVKISYPTKLILRSSCANLRFHIENA